MKLRSLSRNMARWSAVLAIVLTAITIHPSLADSNALWKYLIFNNASTTACGTWQVTNGNDPLPVPLGGMDYTLVDNTGLVVASGTVGGIPNSQAGLQGDFSVQPTQNPLYFIVHNTFEGGGVERVTVANEPCLPAPAKSPVIPSQPTSFQCPGNAPVALEANQQAVVQGPEPNALRDLPGLTADGSSVTHWLPVGSVVAVDYGPICKSGYPWYFVEWPIGGQTNGSANNPIHRGWTAAAGQTDVWLMPTQVTAYPTALPPPPSYCPDQPGKTDNLFPVNTTSTTVANLLSPRAADTWIVHGLAGQKLSLQLISSTGKAYLIVAGANRTILLGGGTQPTSFSGILPATQDYYITVNSNSLACSSYTLTASMSNTPPPPSYCPDQPGKTDNLFPVNTTSTTVTNSLSKRAADTWIVHGLAGQKLSLQLISSTGKAYLIVAGANRTILLSGDTQPTSFSGILPATQDYYIIVNSNSLACSSYTLTASLF